MAEGRQPHEFGRPQSEQSRQPDDRLREANEHLTLAALRAQEEAEESTRRYSREAELNATLLKKQQQLRWLASELTLAEQRERKRLAAELHDYLAQMMVLGRLKIGQARKKLTTADTHFARLTADIDEIFSKSLAYTRSIMAELSPPVLQELGLPPALRWLGEQMVKHGLSVDVRLSQGQMPLRDDQAMLLYQSVRELLLNVLKHAAPDHAAVTLSLEDDETMKVTVQDEGQGSSRPLFEEKTAGEHFGLFSIRERMEAMGGSMTADSVVGRGTTVTLRVPLAPAISCESACAPASERPFSRVRTTPQASGIPRLLLVEDHALVRQGLRAILEGFSDLSVIGEAANGVEAVSMAADQMPDVVLMDINMPHMDGIEATRRIKAAQPKTIVIGLSVNNVQHLQEAMQAAGAGAFVSKDAAAEQLHDVITALIPWHQDRRASGSIQAELPFS